LVFAVGEPGNPVRLGDWDTWEDGPLLIPEAVPTPLRHSGWAVVETRPRPACRLHGCLRPRGIGESPSLPSQAIWPSPKTRHSFSPVVSAAGSGDNFGLVVADSDVGDDGAFLLPRSVGCHVGLRRCGIGESPPVRDPVRLGDCAVGFPAWSVAGMVFAVGEPWNPLTVIGSSTETGRGSVILPLGDHRPQGIGESFPLPSQVALPWPDSRGIPSRPSRRLCR
jgi:hypothetical protein